MRLLSTVLTLSACLHLGSGYSELSDATLKSLPRPGNDFDIKNGALLSPLLRTRVPGTPGQDAAIAHLTGFFEKHLPKWKITMHNSTSTTPTSNGKKLPFRNIIATRDPPWIKSEGNVKRLALVAHFDSKITPDGFIGATDSAAPCAMILHAVRSIDDALTKKWDAMQAKGIGEDLEDDFEQHQGIQVLFLDGEEAFLNWSDDDSLYGARALAEDWEFTMNAAGSHFKNPLESIEMFVLLDLLGAANPIVPSYFKLTHWAYLHIGTAEQKLRKLGVLKTKNTIFRDMEKSTHNSWIRGYIEDDHVPFMRRGVSILHLITSPFPHVWHTLDDDGEHLDMDTVEDWAMITTAFAAEWMELEGYFDPPRPLVKRSDSAIASSKTEL